MIHPDRPYGNRGVQDNREVPRHESPHHHHHHHHDRPFDDRVDLGRRDPGAGAAQWGRWKSRHHGYGHAGTSVETAAAATAGSLAGAAVHVHGRSGVGRVNGSHLPPTTNLKEIARRQMLANNLLPDFGKADIQQLDDIQKPAPIADGVRDMRKMLWCSIDNDDSRDLDQLSVAEKTPEGDTRIYVAIADVDGLVPKGTPLDQHAEHNTTSVYTADKIFPMFPPKLSTDLTSLNGDADRNAMIIEYTVGENGSIKNENVYRGYVHNYAKLAYNSVAAWLDGTSPMPDRVAKVPGMEQQLRMQYAAAQKLKERRHENGALTLETIEPRADVQNGVVTDLHIDEKNCAKEIIEDFMVAANGVTARFLARKGFPTLMRVVQKPEKWNRIVEVAAEKGATLPAEPNAAALEKFLTDQKTKDPLRFPDLSLTIVKLLGRGQYIVSRPGQNPVGHFGLAVKDYSHSTAPNRRYPDLITERMLKAALAGQPCPYSVSELETLAEQCTEMENSADKVERAVRKSAAALHLHDKIGQTFDAIVTGAADKGTWVRVLRPPVEGKLVQGEQGLRVGDKVHVRLVSTNVERGFIDFARTGGQ